MAPRCAHLGCSDNPFANRAGIRSPRMGPNASPSRSAVLCYPRMGHNCSHAGHTALYRADSTPSFASVSFLFITTHKYPATARRKAPVTLFLWHHFVFINALVRAIFTTAQIFILSTPPPLSLSHHPYRLSPAHRTICLPRDPGTHSSIYPTRARITCIYT